MTEKPLGKSGLSIRPFVLGGHVFGFPAAPAAGFAVLCRYVGLGGGGIRPTHGKSAWGSGHKGGEPDNVLVRGAKEKGHETKG